MRLPQSPTVRAVLIAVPALLAISPGISAASRTVSWGAATSPAASDLTLDALGTTIDAQGGTEPVTDPNQPVLPDGTDPTRLLSTPAVVAALPAAPVVATAQPGDTTLPAELMGSGIPVRVLRAYLSAAIDTGRRQPACHLSWALLAAIGRVESNHGRFGGSSVTARGLITPPIYGPRLDGTAGMARIGDTDGGRWDGDPVYDRAMGPMQFIPTTWRGYGADGNGDHLADPQNIDDAALTAGRYLCTGGLDLATTTGRWNAILSYNYSSDYAATVSALADSYATGVVAAVPMTPAGAKPAPATAPAPTTLAPRVVPQVAPAPNIPPVTPTIPGAPTTSSSSSSTISSGTSTTPSPPTPSAATESPSSSAAATSPATSVTPTDSPTATPSAASTPTPTDQMGSTAAPTPSDSPSPATGSSSTTVVPTPITTMAAPTPASPPTATPATSSPSTASASPSPT